MARVKTGSPTQDQRGRLGGSVISSNAVGWYVKGFVPPYKSRSEAQAQARRVFLLANNAWSNLSGANVSAWIALAGDPDYYRLDWWGDPYRLSGHALYIAVAVVQFGLSGTFPTSPPTNGFPAAAPVAVFDVTSSEGVPRCTVIFSTAPDASIYRVRLAVAMQRGGTSAEVSAPPILVGYLTVGHVVPTDFETELQAVLGLIPRGATLSFSVAAVSGEGLVGPPVIYRVVTAQP